MVLVPGRREILELTSFRTFAALHVVLFHNFYLLGIDMQTLPAWAVRLINTGSTAVSFFFVLSGFILAYSYCGADGALRTTTAEFHRARVGRIYPVYLLGLLLDAPRAIAYFIGAFGMKVGGVKALVSGVGCAALIQSWFPRITSSWNAPGWSLSAEAFFYALFPLLAAWVWARKGRTLAVASIAAYVLPLVVYVGAVRLHATSSATWPTMWRSNPLLRLPEFFLGIVVGRGYLSVSAQGASGQRRDGLHAFLALATLAAIVVLLAADTGIPPSLLETGLLGPLFAATIYLFAIGRFAWVGPFRARVPVVLGKASYAIYILHQPVKLYVLAIMARVGVTSGPLLFAVYLAFVVGLSVALTLFFEEPARRWVVRRLRGNRQPSAPMLAPTAIVDRDA